MAQITPRIGSICFYLECALNREIYLIHVSLLLDPNGGFGNLHSHSLRLLGRPGPGCENQIPRCAYANNDPSRVRSKLKTCLNFYSLLPPRSAAPPCGPLIFDLELTIMHAIPLCQLCFTLGALGVVYIQKCFGLRF